MNDNCNCACTKTTERTEEQIKKLVNRLNRIEGQIRGMRKMIEAGAYCADILTQSAAAGAAINSFNRDLLAAHIENCVARDIKTGKEGAAEELVQTVLKLIK